MEPLTPDAPRTADPTPLPVHRRTLTFDAFEEDRHIRVLARLRDERPWQRAERVVLHHMELQVRIRTGDLVITEAVAGMHSFPHEECPLIAPKFAELQGLSIARGFTAELQQRFRGVSGCSHLFELSRALGSAVFQSVMSVAARARRDVPHSDVPPSPQEVEQMVTPVRGTCHIWAPDGPAERKVRAGVNLDGPYPVPAVAD